MKLNELLEMSNEELFEIVGYEVSTNKFALNNPKGSEEAKELGKSWFQRHKAQFAKVICCEKVKEIVEKKTNETALLFMVMGLIAPLGLGVSHFIVSLLCIRIGIKSFCSWEDVK